MWLALTNKLLTWEKGLKRGWIGPGQCPLCKINKESSTHLFIVSPYIVQMFKLVSSKFKQKASRVGKDLDTCLRTWLEDRLVKQVEDL